MGEARQRLDYRTGRIGYAARGCRLLRRPAHFSCSRAPLRAERVKGLDCALRHSRKIVGPWVLGLVAVGLVAYGFYMLVEARPTVISQQEVKKRMKDEGEGE